MRRSLCVAAAVLGLVTLARGGRADRPPTRPAAAPSPPAAASPPATSLRLPPPLAFDQSPDAPTPVLFRHTTHVSGRRSECLTCHPEPYRMLRPQRRATHQEMDAGRSCGACHDGKRAFATSDGERCEGCHTGEAVTP